MYYAVFLPRNIFSISVAQQWLAPWLVLELPGEFQKMFMTKPQLTLEKFIAKAKIVFKYPGNSNVQSELRSLG